MTTPTRPRSDPGRLVVQVRVSPTERLRFELRAQELDLTMSEWLRLLARRDAGLWMPEGERLPAFE